MSVYDEDRPGNGGASSWPTTTATTLWNPCGRPDDVTEKAPLALVVTTSVYVPVKPRPPIPTASERMPWFVLLANSI